MLLWVSVATGEEVVGIIRIASNGTHKVMFYSFSFVLCLVGFTVICKCPKVPLAKLIYGNFGKGYFYIPSNLQPVCRGAALPSSSRANTMIALPSSSIAKFLKGYFFNPQTFILFYDVPLCQAHLEQT